MAENYCVPPPIQQGLAMLNSILVRKCLFSFLICFVIIQSSPGYAQNINVGVLAIKGIENGKSAWQPTIDYLDTQIPEHKFNLELFEPGTNMKDFEISFKKGELHFVIVPPVLYIDFENLFQSTRVLTLVDKSGHSKFGSAYIVRSDNNTIHRLEDAKNKKIAAVSKRGFAGWLIGKLEFLDNGVDLLNDSQGVDFLGNQFKVAESVLSGAHDIGIVRTGIIEQLISMGKMKPDESKPPA